MTITFNTPPCEKVNWLRTRPFAHRGLHDASKKIYENTLSACRLAMNAGYNMEVDLQPSCDGVPMVFHDYTLDRLTNTTGDIRNHSAQALKNLSIMDSDDHIPTLQELLDLIQGKAGILLELKGKIGSDDGFVEAVSKALEGYEGDVAIMSFHHHILDDARAFAPDVSLGLTAEGDDKAYDMHAEICNRANPSFVSYEVDNLDCRFVSEFLLSGRPLISWTVRSEEDAAFSAKYADQPTFEGFLA